MRKNLVVKDNALINASYNLELMEQRLILLAISQAKLNNKQPLTSDARLQIKVSDYAGTYSIEGRSVYENLKKACKKLFERKFTYAEKQEKGTRIVTSRWVSEIGYNDKTATVDMVFAPSVVPLINNLEDHFTSYDLEQVSGLNSKYSVRLYEIIISWRSIGKTPMISIENLRNMLGILDGEYKEIEPLKRRVIDLAVKEITEKTDITVTYEQHKSGRKITAFTFSFKQKKKLKEITEKRDTKTIDMFKPIKMTNKQRSYFASKLSRLHECSQLPNGRESYEALAKWIEQDLLKPERADFYRPLLAKLDYKE